MRTLDTKPLWFELSQEDGGFYLFVGGAWNSAAGYLAREELVRLKTMIEETLNGSNTTNQ